MTESLRRPRKPVFRSGLGFSVFNYGFLILLGVNLATFFLFGGDDSRSAVKNQPGKLTLHPAVRGGGATLTTRFYF